jgi:hypothetical protein
VAVFVAGEADARRAAQVLAVDPAEQMQGLGEAAEFGDRAAQAGGSPSALQDAQ